MAVTTGGSEVLGSQTVHMTRDAVGVITSVDDGVTEMLGWRPDQLIGSPSTRFIHPADQASGVAAWLDMVTSPGVPRAWRGRYQSADGAWTWIESVNCLEDGEVPVVFSSITRVTGEQVSIEEELRAREQLLSRLSDALPVGVIQIDLIGNVTFTNDRLHTIVGVVVFLDLDRFKAVNDRFGRAAGDRLLVAAADRLRSALRDCDRVGRLGGDEFLVVCPRVKNAAQARTIAGRIADAMSSTIDIGPASIELHVSIGVAWTAEPLDADEFIEQADRAMYESKRVPRTAGTMLGDEQRRAGIHATV